MGTARSLRDRLRDRFAAGEPERAAEELLKGLDGGDAHRDRGGWGQVLDLLRGLPAESRGALLRTVADRFPARYGEDGADVEERLRILSLCAVAGEGLPDDPLAAGRTAALADLGRLHRTWDTPLLDAVVAAEPAAGRSLTPATVAAIRRTGQDRYAPAELAALARTLTDPVLNAGEDWADQALRDATDPELRALLAHCRTATAGKPPAAWDERARSLVDAAGPDRVRTAVLSWLSRVGRPRTLPLTPRPYEAHVNDVYDPCNADALRGLAWLLSLLPPHPGTARALGALVETSLRKVTGVGPRSPKVANAGVVALARTDGEAAFAELARLAARVTYKATAKILDTALRARADALGLSREEVEELAVPAYGLTGVGHAEHRFGEATATVAVHGTRAGLSWRGAAGRPVRSVPAAVRRDHADALKDLKASVKDIDRMLSAQSERLDRQFLARRVWPYAAWRERYLDHPLVGTLARRLLWTVDGTAAGYADGALRTLTGTPVTDGTEVALWHPVGADPAETVAWRDWLERHGVTQPFKQAHREVYLLTDAERATGTYSNRFAAHVLRQHQFHSLAAVRGWRNKLRLCVDDEAPPATRDLPAWGLRAEFWVQGDGGEYLEDTTESGSFLRLRTDQVRFYPIDAPENSAHCSGGAYRMWLRDGRDPVDPLPLDAVPPLVLSEVLRDVDLFVGVASVGNDPTWQDGGPGGRFREYWTSYGFGELNQSARTRRELLERLIPRLAIAGRCRLEGRFLHVKGERHTYRIHLGSGNILRSPDDRYLCIVPRSGAGPAGTGYLPFEGDRTLAVILSKALMLADDTSITDPTVLSQL
ncbi:DUF4132 domain-containing protein [Streptomyces griseoviridis]|uniref:DUF4132 domain-containing protein n=1 Tax=Streptomyces griseoviridis TaxID=45398 RepID=A0ABT9LIY9_STRGD|nr:DUF4132 domain-containing protein [Streptomyces griseoviridis]MDP9683668.1 hypothetical protein [Streptomyces griseoviridis]GGS93233.1 hypothetical protein GCM10010240_28200 [Streptomyces griseoviridis]